MTTTRLKAVLFDWAGTTVDHGSRAPVEVFVELFRREGVPISVAQAREPMGRAKWDHIAAILFAPEVAGRWREAHDREPSPDDVQRMYRDFLPLQKEILARGSDVIPGVPEAVAECRRRGLKIGSSTGYTRELMDVVIPMARAGGYEADTVLCADDVPAGRPAPWMNFRAAERLGVFPPRAIVVVDDTLVGIEAGRNAGMWAVGVTRTGNSLGMSLDEVRGTPAATLSARVAEIGGRFLEAGADFVVESVADLIPVLDQIERRLSAE